MELTEKQKRILAGEICPYCGRETQLVNADEIYHEKGMGMVMMCKPCKAWVGIHTDGPNKGKAKGRLAGPSLRSLKIRVHAELDGLWKTKEERGDMYKSLSEFLGIPPEYTHIGMFSEKTMSNVFEFCMINKNISGSNIEWFRNGDKCPHKNGVIVAGTSACRGCPNYLHDKDQYVWCDQDMSYGKLKIV